MITFTRAVTVGTRHARVTAEPSWRTGDKAMLDVVWCNGRVGMMLSPLWAHVVGVDMSPVARLIRRMELDLARCHQLALMRRAASLPSGAERFVPGRAARTDEEPVQ